MDDQRHWRDAVQSAFVSIVVGKPLCEYRLPRGLLQHSVKLSELFPSCDTTSVVLSRLPGAKIEIFIDWCHQCRLPDDLSLTLAKTAMEFALDFEVPILQNQLADRFRQQILKGKWILDLETTAWAYRTIPAGTKVRRLFALSLYSTPSPVHSVAEQEVLLKQLAAQKWHDLCLKLPELGAAFAALRFMPDAERGLQKAGRCEFHNHCPSGGQGCLTFDDLWRQRKSAESSLGPNSWRTNKTNKPRSRYSMEEAPVAEEPEAEVEAVDVVDETLAVAEEAPAGEEEAPAAEEEAPAAEEEPRAVEEPVEVEPVAADEWGEPSAVEELVEVAPEEDYWVGYRSGKEKKKKGRQ